MKGFALTELIIMEVIWVESKFMWSMEKNNWQTHVRCFNFLFFYFLLMLDCAERGSETSLTIVVIMNATCYISICIRLHTPNL